MGGQSVQEEGKEAAAFMIVGPGRQLARCDWLRSKHQSSSL